MRSRKRSILTYLIFFIITLMLILVMVGCANAPSNSLSTEITDISTENQDVIITFSYDENAYPMFKPLMEAFNKENPSITVQYVPLTERDYNNPKTVEDRLLMLAKSADTTLTSIRTASMSGYFLDLQPLIDSDSTFDPTDFWSMSLSAMEDTEGRVLGLPMTLYLRGIFYDKSAFDAANLAYPQPGWTWDDFRAAIAALAQGQGEDIRFGYADRSSASILQPLIDSIISQNDGVIGADSLATELDWYVQMVQADQLLGLKSTDDYWNALFNFAGPPAMWYGSLFEFALGFVTGEPEATDLMTYFSDSTYGFAPFPVDSNGENRNTTPMSALCGVISAGSEHPVEAWQWLKYLSEHWLVSDTSSASSQLQIPARHSVANAEGFWGNYPLEVQEVMQYGLEHAWFPSLYSRAESAVLNAVEDAAVGRATDLLSALEEAEKQQASWPQEIPVAPEIVVETPQPSGSTALDVVTINFYHKSWETEEKAAITALVNQFNKDHKDEIIVKADNTTEESYEEGYYAGMANTYDCFLSQIDPQGATSSGAILDLTALMEAEEAAFQEDFDPLMLDAAQYNEGLYALPLYNQPAIMVYNADLLADLGLEPPPLDWTFDEFLALITAVTSSSGEEQVFGFLPDSHRVNTTEMFFAGYGVQWRDISGEFPFVLFDTSEMADALVWFNELEQSGVIFQPSSGADWYSSITNAIQSGQIAFWTDIAGNEEKDFFSYNKPLFEVGIVPLPSTTKPNGSYDSSYMTGFYISNLTEYPQACWELAKYFSLGMDVLPGVPARLSVANSPEWEAYVGAENAEVYRMAVASNQDDVGVDTYNVWFWIPIKDWLSQADQNIENGNDPTQELTLVQQYVDAYLECMAPHDVLSLNNDELWEIAQSCRDEADTSYYE